MPKASPIQQLTVYFLTKMDDKDDKTIKQSRSDSK